MFFVAEGDQHHSLARIARLTLTKYSVAEGDEHQQTAIVAHFQRANVCHHLPSDSR